MSSILRILAWNNVDFDSFPMPILGIMECWTSVGKVPELW
jgi:hypothetical protein